MKYHAYRFSKQFYLSVGFVGLVFSIVVAVLFYGSAFGLLSFPVILLFVWKHCAMNYLQKQKTQMKLEFQEILELLRSHLQAGTSIEQAFIHINTNTMNVNLLKSELERISQGLANHCRIETLLLETGARSGIEEIQEFAKLLQIAKKHGGNLIFMMEQLMNTIEEEMRLELEVETMVAAKKYEGMIMLAMPFGIVAYLRMTNPGYMDVMYESVTGRIMMTVCLFVIFICYLWIDKLVRIEV